MVVVLAISPPGRAVTLARALATALVLALTVHVHGQALLLWDAFDEGESAGNWMLWSAGGDFSADFAFDYSTRGIPPAPNSVGGSTIGLKFTVNDRDAIAATDAVSAYPIGESFRGDYTLRFDMWLNYNGGAGGGTGSTEFMTTGIAHAAAQVVWAGNPASDGHWFAVSGEGGDSDDYRAYAGASLLSVPAGGYAAASRNHTAPFYQALFPNPPYETQGAPGKHWVEVEVSHRGGVIEWRLNGMLIAIYAATFEVSGAVMIGYMDTYPSIADPAADNFLLVDNVCVEAPDCNTNGKADERELVGGTSLDCNSNAVPDECDDIAAGDFDADGDVDLDDVAALVNCLGGPGSPADPPGAFCAGACLAAFDAGADSSVDLRDFAAFQSAFAVGPIPPRPSGAPTGRQFIAEVAGMSRAQREAHVLEEVTGGNVPGFLRTFVPIEVSAVIGGGPIEATYFVLPDYLSIGIDDDFVRMPMTPLIAQPIADSFECLLPTRKMVNDIYAQAPVKLAPSPISPATVDITLATTFFRHHERIEEQRAGYPLGPAVGGIKKDVVVTPLLAGQPGHVAIYGWHRLDGTPIQPLYLGHIDTYVDYSHGIRLVGGTMVVEDAPVRVADVLADPELHVLLSDEGVVTDPRY